METFYTFTFNTLNGSTNSSEVTIVVRDEILSGIICALYSPDTDNMTFNVRSNRGISLNTDDINNIYYRHYINVYNLEPPINNHMFDEIATIIPITYHTNTKNFMLDTTNSNVKVFKFNSPYFLQGYITGLKWLGSTDPQSNVRVYNNQGQSIDVSY